MQPTQAHSSQTLPLRSRQNVPPRCPSEYHLHAQPTAPTPHTCSSSATANSHPKSRHRNRVGRPHQQQARCWRQSHRQVHFTNPPHTRRSHPSCFLQAVIWELVRNSILATHIPIIISLVQVYFNLPPHIMIWRHATAARKTHKWGLMFTVPATSTMQ
ncbi:hypothetical protein BS17DRAFT_564941 [Gyrodon lividus]|nr:hypothetical protein BS17DRAFT_564941 [Gyrodon lividus]